ncbi:MAG: DUF2155 domain-containing protein [Rhodoblastus sp.]
MRLHFTKSVFTKSVFRAAPLALGFALGGGVLCGLPGAAHADKIKHPTAVFAGLDKITGRIIAFDVAIDETVQFGSLQITPRVCYSRPATEAPLTDAFVEVDELLEDKKFKRIFSGWMFAASPGLHGVEHPVYDVWLTDCQGQGPLIQTPAEAKREEAPPPNADVVSPGVEAKPKTTKRKVEPKTPPVVQPDIGATAPAPEAPAPRRSGPGRWFGGEGAPNAGPDPAGR